MLHLKVFIVKRPSIDGFTSTAISNSEITTLAHKTGNDTVKEGRFEVQRSTSLAFSLFASAKQRVRLYMCVN
jgi:hypothetical protein